MTSVVSADSVVLERDGLLECIEVLNQYCCEVYKDGIIPPGVKGCIEKLNDKVKLCEGQLSWLTHLLESTKS